MRVKVRTGSAWLDLIVVMGIIGMLVGILVPMILTARQRSTRANCANNLRQIGQAMHAYAADNDGRLPCTRPAADGDPLPDVSASGAESADPYGPAGPRRNNVPAALFLLIRTEGVSPSAFVCPNTLAIPDRLEGKRPSERSNFTDVGLNLSYSMQNPYASEAAERAGYDWSVKLPPDFVIVADRNPGPVAWRNVTTAPTTGPTTAELATEGNSRNHDGEGQNVLYLDGRVEFQRTPFAGVGLDNIYLTKGRGILASPKNREDTILLPADN